MARQGRGSISATPRLPLQVAANGCQRSDSIQFALQNYPQSPHSSSLCSHFPPRSTILAPYHTDFVSARHSTSSVQSSSTAAPIAISSHFARRCSRHNATPGLLFTPAVSQVLYLQCFLEVSGTFARSWTHTSPLIASPPANNHLQAPMHTHQRPNSQPYIDQPLVTRGAAAKSIFAWRYGKEQGQSSARSLSAMVIGIIYVSLCPYSQIVAIAPKSTPPFGVIS